VKARKRKVNGTW